MQYELRTQVIEPRRKTFQYLVDRYGDRPASRYEEGTIDVQAREHFHYRPLWDPEHELYDESSSALRLTDPYSFTDPRQYYYAPYVTARAGLHEGFAKTLEYLESRELLERMPEGWRALAAQVVLPLRHFESGAQLVTVTGARFAYGTTISQCCAYAAFDRIGNAQLLSRFGISLAGGSDSALTDAKALWVEEPSLQALRRFVEELFVDKDWAAGFVGLDLVDRLLYPLLYRHLDEAALLGGAGAYSLVAQHLSEWFADQRRWIDRLYDEWLADPTYGTDNRKALSVIVDRRLQQAIDAVLQLAGAADALVAADAVASVNRSADALRATLAEQGLLGIPAPRTEDAR